MHKKVLTSHPEAMNTLLTHNLVDTVGDSKLGDTFKTERDCKLGDTFKTETDWDDYGQPQRFSVKSRPLVISNVVRTKDLKSAFGRIESRKKETLYKMNWQYDILLNIRKEYISLTKESMHIQRELNARETLLRLDTNSPIRHKINMQVENVKRSITENAGEVNKIVVDGEIMEGSTKAIIDDGKMDIDNSQPSTSRDTSFSSKEPVVDIDNSQPSTSRDTSFASKEPAGNDSKQELSNDFSSEKDSAVNCERTGNYLDESMEVEDAGVSNDGGSHLESEKKPIDLDKSSDMDVDLLSPEVFKRYQCALCGKRYVDKRCFDSHVDAHAGVVHTCSKCPSRKFKNSQSYHRHDEWHKRGEIYLKCQTCGDEFEEKY